MVEKRSILRRRVLKAGTLAFGGAAIKCTVRNLTTSGALLEVESRSESRDNLCRACPLPQWHGSRTPHPLGALYLFQNDNDFVDVRETDERRKTGTLKGAVHAPRGFLNSTLTPTGPTHVKALSSGKRLVLYCASGNRSALAARTLKSKGIANVSHVAGGFPALQKAGGDTEKRRVKRIVTY